MTNTNLLHAMGHIDPQLIADAAPDVTQKDYTKRTWIKWTSLAAGLALALIFSGPLITNLFITNDSPIVITPIVRVKYDQCLYEIVKDDPDTLKKHGLPDEVTADAIGEHIAYLKEEQPENKYTSYVEASDNETADFELLRYAPIDCEAVRIFRDGDEFYFVLLCNYDINYSESMPIDAFLDVYNIKSAADIVSITPVKTDNSWNAISQAITDKDALVSFYNELITLQAYSGLAYGDTIDSSDKIVDDNGLAHSKRALNLKAIVIETREGLRFALDYYPTYGWIYGSVTLSYYKMSPALSQWFADNVK